MDNVVVVACTATNGIADGVAEILNVPLVKVESRTLPDGESYIRVPVDVSDKTAVIVQSLYPPQDKHIIELILTMDAVKGYRPGSIVLVMPYLAYSRQNKRFLPGEPISIEVILRMLRSEEADAIVTVDPHRQESIKSFNGNYAIVDPISLFAELFGKRSKDMVVLAPDKGALSKAMDIASVLKVQFTQLEKERDRKTGEVRLVGEQNFRFEGRDVLIIDDIVSTGNTVIQAAKFAKLNGAGDIAVAASHLLISEETYKRMVESGISRVVGTNTVPCKYSETIDVSPLIAEALKKIL